MEILIVKENEVKNRFKNKIDGKREENKRNENMCNISQDMTAEKLTHTLVIT